MTTSHARIDATHAPDLRSWVESANQPGCDFPIQNLPLGMFRRRRSAERYRPGVAIGDAIVDLLAARALLPAAVVAALEACDDGLNALMARGPGLSGALRQALSQLLAAGSPAQAALSACLVPQADADLGLPCRIGDYSDFYTGIYHATNAGKQFRPDNPLLPNYKWVPIAYHGRASSIVASGHAFPRPQGQIKGPDDAAPRLAPSGRLDYELELGVLIGRGNALGESVPIGQAEQHAFGMVLLNDWSARDVQGWEYQPLGPFLAKNFVSTISPWVVTMEALAPFRAPFTRPADDPQPLPYLEHPDNRAAGALDIRLEVLLETAAMRAAGAAPARLSRSNYADAYWTLAQMITHQAVNGCNMQPGDLLGTGTQSDPDPANGGALLELTRGGKEPLRLPNGETRTFLQDGDTVILRAHCERPGRARIGFGECRGTVLPAR